MPKDWSGFTKDGIHEENDFRAAAYQLLTQQVLYEREKSDRLAYNLVNGYRNAFREAFDLFGMDLEFDDAYRYCAAIPRTFRRAQLTLMETLLMLVLRKIYHEQAIHADLVDGSAFISIDTLQEAYRAETGRELPATVRELDPLFDTMRRFGLLRKTEAEPGSAQPFGLEIRPGIEKLVNENMLTRMAAYQNASAANQEGEDAKESANEAA